MKVYVRSFFFILPFDTPCFFLFFLSPFLTICARSLALARLYPRCLSAGCNWDDGEVVALAVIPFYNLMLLLKTDHVFLCSVTGSLSMPDLMLSSRVIATSTTTREPPK